MKSDISQGAPMGTDKTKDILKEILASNTAIDE